MVLGCPIFVEITPALNVDSCPAHGRGLVEKGVRINEKADFNINRKSAGGADIQVIIQGPGGNLDVTMNDNAKGDLISCFYYPRKEGKYVIQITFDGKNIPKSPFEVFIGPEAGPQGVRAYGPGLHGGMIGRSAEFVVERIGKEKREFTIKLPSKVNNF